MAGASTTAVATRLTVGFMVVALFLGAALPAAAQGNLGVPDGSTSTSTPSPSSTSSTLPRLLAPTFGQSSLGTLQTGPVLDAPVPAPPEPPPAPPAPAPSAAPTGDGPGAASGGSGPPPPVVPTAPPAVVGPPDPRLIAQPSNTNGLVKLLDQLTTRQRELIAKVQALEAAAAVTGDAIVAGPDSGRVSQILAQEKELLSRVQEATRADRQQVEAQIPTETPAASPPITPATPPSTTPTAPITGGPPGATLSGLAAPLESRPLPAVSPTPVAPVLPRNPAAVTPCSPTLLSPNRCSQPQAPVPTRPGSELIRESATRFLLEYGDRRAEQQSQLRDIKQDLEAAHLRAVTNVAQGSTTPAPAPATAAQKELADARRQLVEVTESLNAVTRAQALGVPGNQGVPPSRLATTDIPPEYLALYQKAATTCSGLSWTVLASIGSIESSHGRSTLPGVREGANYAGAMGPMQFIASSWDAYGVDADGDGVKNVYKAPDAVFAAARYLCNNGGGDPARLRGAIWSYNHADWYVNRVIDLAIRYGSSPLDALATATTAADVARNPKITLTNEARADLLAGIVDPRVVNLLAAAAAEHRIAVSVIKTGHSVYVKGTNRVSNHFYARAVDIYEVDGANVTSGNRAALDLSLAILTSASSLRPDEFGSPWLLAAFAGAFSDADHTDHLHVGYQAPGTATAR